MPLLPHPLPHDLGRSFTPAQARAAGTSRGRLAASDLTAPFHGSRQVRRVADIPHTPNSGTEPFAPDRQARSAHLHRLEGYLPVMPDHAFTAGLTAAACHGLPVTPTDDIEIGVVAPHRTPRRDGIRGRKLAPHLVSVVELDLLDRRVRVASCASTWAMLAGGLSVRQLVRIGDACVRIPRDRRGRPLPDAQLASIAHLRAAASAGRRLGATRLRTALGLIRVGSMSPLETDLRLDLVESGLPEPQLDVEIRTPHGRLIGIADAAYPQHRVLIEVEGDHHRTDRAQWHRDIEKHAGYVDAGWRVVRLTSAHIRGPRATAAAVVARALGFS